MAAVNHRHAYPFSSPRPTVPPLQTARRALLIAFVASIAIGMLMTLAIVLAGPVPIYDGPAWPQPMAQPSAGAGLDR